MLVKIILLSVCLLGSTSLWRDPGVAESRLVLPANEGEGLEASDLDADRKKNADGSIGDQDAEDVQGGRAERNAKVEIGSGRTQKEQHTYDGAFLIIRQQF